MSMDEAKSIMIDCVEQALIKDYKYSQANAELLVDGSAFIDVLNGEPNLVMHYSAEYWAKDIVQKYNMLINSYRK
jgi:hypothetical protein